MSVRLDEMHRQSWFSKVAELLKQPYVLSCAFLFVATVSVWMGIRHQQAARLKSIEDVIQIQEKYIGSESPKDVARNDPSVKQDLPLARESKAAQTSTAPEQVVPEEDRALVENIDLLENYDFIKNLDLVDSRANGGSSAGTN